MKTITGVLPLHHITTLTKPRYILHILKPTNLGLDSQEITQILELHLNENGFQFVGERWISS